MDVLRRSRPAQIGVAVAFVLVIAAGGWFLLVKPKKNDAKELAAQIATVEAALTARKEELSRPYAAVQVRAADLYRLTRALPDHVDVPGIVLQLDRLAKGNKVTLEAVSPSARVPATGHDEVPLAVRVQGRFANVSKFVGAVQRLTRVKNERLDSTGRLYVVKSVTLGEASSLGFPFVSGELGVSAYAFTGSAPVVQPGATTTGDESVPTASPSGLSEAAGANR